MIGGKPNKHYKLSQVILPVRQKVNGEYSDRWDLPPKPRRGPNFTKSKRKKK